MIEIGRLCVKLAGRDAGKKCVIADVLDKNFVLIDGETRRRKCNIRHLEPLKDMIKIKKGAASSEISAEFKKLGIEVKETKKKEKAEKPKKLRGKDKKPSEEKPKKEKKKADKKEKPAEKKEAPKKETKKEEPKKK